MIINICPIMLSEISRMQKTTYSMIPKLSDRKQMGLPGTRSLGRGLTAKDSMGTF